MAKRSLADAADEDNGNAKATPAAGASKKARRLTIAGTAAPGESRYRGTIPTGNKRALLDVLDYRQNELRLPLSIPEQTALDTSTKSSTLETGKANTTEEMPAGTAICHKIADKSIRDKINELLKLPNQSILESYLDEGLRYITPDHTAQQTPDDGPYHAEAQSKLNKAAAALDKLKSPTLDESKRAGYAHAVGESIANSPVNLFIGDSSQNSSNQDNFDPNINFAQLTEKDDAYTPRSLKADRFSIRFHPGSRNAGQSSSYPRPLGKSKRRLKPAVKPKAFPRKAKPRSPSFTLRQTKSKPASGIASGATIA